MDMADGGSIALNVVVFLIALAFCALFSFLETSLMALRLFQLKELAQKTGKYQTLFAALERDPNRLLNAILIAYNLANTIAATAGTFVIEESLSSLPSSLSYIIGVVIITGALLIIGDILPKNIVKFRGEKYFASTLWLTNLTFYLLYPFVNLLGKFTDAVLRLIIGPQADDGEPVTSEKEIQFLIDYIDEKGLMEREKTNMLQSIFRLSTTSVRDIMIPDTDIIMIEVSKTVQDAHALFNKYQFSRLPVYKDSPNNVIGMLHFKDLVPVLAKNLEKPIKDLMRPILFIPESIKVNQLLKELKTKRMHIAMVINEHGSITGLATLEDVLEEIVGEIHDEYEAITADRVTVVSPGIWLVDARTELEKLGLVLKTKFISESGAATLGGFLVEQFQRLPDRGEKLEYHGFSIEIQKVTDKKIVQVIIRQQKDLPEKLI